MSRDGHEGIADAADQALERERMCGVEADPFYDHDEALARADRLAEYAPANEVTARRALYPANPFSQVRRLPARPTDAPEAEAA